MIEIIIKKYLDGHLDVPSFFEHEAEAPDSFVIIQKLVVRSEIILVVRPLLFKAMVLLCRRLLSLM